MEARIAFWRMCAISALSLYATGLMLAFGLRAWLQFRRTGDWGFRRIGNDEPIAGRLGSLLFVSALALTTVGLVAGVLAPLWRLPLPAGWAWVGVAVSLVGLAAVIASQFAMGASWRVGVDPHEETDLITDGPFALVRNPIFSAMGATLIGLALMVPNAVVILAVPLCILGVQLQVRIVEEPYLVQTHGDRYVRYARRTGRFLPTLGRL